MGIKDLLQQMSGVMIAGSIKILEGKRIAIDCSNWLHKGVFASAEEYVDSGFVDTQLYVDFIIGRVRNLVLCGGVIPVVVFDGRRNGLKNETRESRADTRHAYLEQGKRLLENMRNCTDDQHVRVKLRAEAISCFQKGLSVTPEMEKATIGAVRKMGIQVIVAPYEADSQLAYLCATKYCAAVLTEDSDLLVYSAVCGVPFPILCKFDRYGAVQAVDLSTIMSPPPPQDPPAAAAAAAAASGSGGGGEAGGAPGGSKFLAELAKSFVGITRGRRMFVQMCILAGCDYCDSVHGIGLVKAQEAVARFRHVEDDRRLDRIVSYFKGQGKKVPEGFLARVKRAELLFHYHPVYCPRTKSVRPLMDFPAPSSASSAASASDANNDGAADDDEGSYEPKHWVGPSVTPQEMRALGLGSEAELLSIGTLRAPAHVTAQGLCEGIYSIGDFSVIPLRFPWDNPTLRPRQDRQSSNWALRRSLMSAVQHGGLLPGQAGSTPAVPSSGASRGSAMHASGRTGPGPGPGQGVVTRSSPLKAKQQQHPFGGIQQAFSRNSAAPAPTYEQQRQMHSQASAAAAARLPGLPPPVPVSRVPVALSLPLPAPVSVTLTFQPPSSSSSFSSSSSSSSFSSSSSSSSQPQQGHGQWRVPPASPLLRRGGQAQEQPSQPQRSSPRKATNAFRVSPPPAPAPSQQPVSLKDLRATPEAAASMEEDDDDEVQIVEPYVVTNSHSLAAVTPANALSSSSGGGVKRKAASFAPVTIASKGGKQTKVANIRGFFLPQ